MNWELVSTSDNEIVERASVEGGWIYRIKTRQGSAHSGFTWDTAVCFVTPPPEPPP